MKHWTTAVIDPPWPYSRASKNNKLTGFSSQKYELLSIDDLALLPVGEIVDGYVFLWTTGPFMPDAVRLIESWGFQWCSMLTWIKRTVNGKLAYGAGYWFRGCTEYVIVAKKAGMSSIKTPLRNAFEAIGLHHSSKPDYLQTEIVEKYFPGPYIELFARRTREGWDCFGDECPGDERDVRETFGRANGNVG